MNRQRHGAREYGEHVKVFHFRLIPGVPQKIQEKEYTTAIEADPSCLSGEMA